MEKKKHADLKMPRQRLSKKVLADIQEMKPHAVWQRIRRICGRWHSTGKRPEIGSKHAIDRDRELTYLLEVLRCKYPTLLVCQLGPVHIAYLVHYFWMRVVLGLRDPTDDRKIEVGTWDNYKSSFAFLLKVIGKVDLLKPMEDYVPEEQWTLIARKRAATVDKSLRAAGIVDPAQWIEETILPLDPELADLFKLGHEFGLRRFETCWVEIDFDVRSRDGEEYLYVRPAGAKNGRPRWVKIETDSQRALILHLKARYGGRDRVRVGARSRNESPKLVLARLNAACARVGLTRNHLGVTFHGLRHGYVHRVFERFTGVPPAVLGGDPRKVDRLVVEKALDAISERTGHSRREICTAYGVIGQRSPLLEYVLEKARGGDFGPRSHPAARRMHAKLHVNIPALKDLVFVASDWRAKARPPARTGVAA